MPGKRLCAWVFSSALMAVAGTASASAAVWQLDVFRVTQGLDHDYSANEDYDKIAGKDLLVRVQPYLTPPVVSDDLLATSQSCTVQQVSRLIAGFEIPLVGVPQSFPAVEGPYQGYPLSTTHYQFLNSAVAHVDCWVPGSAVADPGRYVFSASIATKSVTTPVAITLAPAGTLFVTSTPLNVLLMPWIHTPEDDRFAPMDIPMYVQMARVAEQLDRTFPLATGVAPINDDGLHPSTAGLHVRYGSAFFCPSGTSFANCDALSRAQAEDEFQYWNATAQKLDSIDHRHRDQFVTGTTMGLVTVLAGGQSCWAGEHVAGSDLSATFDDNSAYILAQEMLHCLGLVDAASPNSDPSNKAHSKNYTIQLNLFNIGSMVNLLDHGDYAPAYSLMFPSASEYANAANTNLLEGHEWNQLRRIAITRNPPPVPINSKMIDLDLMIDRRGTSTGVIYSGLSTVNTLPLTAPAAGSDYSLVFYDPAGAPMQTVPVDVSFDTSDHGAETEELDVRNLNLRLVVPDGAAGWALTHTGVPLLSRPLAVDSPSFVDLEGVNDEDNHAIHLRWAASGGQYYRVFFQSSPSTPQLLVANGLTEPAYDVATDFLPWSPRGTLTVVASNGTQVAMRSIRAMVSHHEVVASILSPAAGTAIAAGTPVTFAGAAADPISPLADARFKWTIDGRPLGNGPVITRALGEGTHTVKLTVIGGDPGGHATASMTLIVGPSPG